MRKSILSTEHLPGHPLLFSCLRVFLHPNCPCFKSSCGMCRLVVQFHIVDRLIESQYHIDLSRKITYPLV